MFDIYVEHDYICLIQLFKNDYYEHLKKSSLSTFSNHRTHK